MEVCRSTGSYAVPAVRESNVHADSPSRGTDGVQRNTSGYVLPQNELARFLTIGPTLVHAYFSITFSIQYPERGTREEREGKRAEWDEGRSRRDRERERDIRTELPRSPSPVPLFFVVLPLVDPFPLPSRIDLLLFLCLRSSRRAERAGCISVGGKPGDQREVGGGRSWCGCQSRSRCFKATLFGPTERRPGRANHQRARGWLLPAWTGGKGRPR